jgi:hypothetical protein
MKKISTATAHKIGKVEGQGLTVGMEIGSIRRDCLRSLGGPQSTTPSETATELFHLLPPFADASGVGQGRS